MKPIKRVVSSGSFISCTLVGFNEGDSFIQRIEWPDISAGFPLFFKRNEQNIVSLFGRRHVTAGGGFHSFGSQPPLPLHRVLSASSNFMATDFFVSTSIRADVAALKRPSESVGHALAAGFNSKDDFLKREIECLFLGFHHNLASCNSFVFSRLVNCGLGQLSPLGFRFRVFTLEFDLQFRSDVVCF